MTFSLHHTLNTAPVSHSASQSHHLSEDIEVSLGSKEIMPENKSCYIQGKKVVHSRKVGTSKEKGGTFKGKNVVHSRKVGNEDGTDIDHKTLNGLMK